MPKLLLIPLEDTVVFPNMTVTLDRRRRRRGARAARAAARGRVREGRHRRRGRSTASACPAAAAPSPSTGLHRGVIGAAADRRRRPPARRGRGAARREAAAASQTRELEREYRAVVEEILELRGADGRIGAFLRSITEPGALADTCRLRARPHLRAEGRAARGRSTSSSGSSCALALQRERLAELQVRRRIRDDVESGAQKQQREYFLRQQMESIRKELGEDEGSVVDEYRTKIDEADMPDDVREQAERELGRLERWATPSGEASMIRTYLDWLLAVPWGEALRGAARPAARARGARRRPRRPRRREGAHRRVPRRAQAARGARHAETTSAPARS